MGQPETSRDIPLPYTTLPVPCRVRVVPSCHGTTWDIPLPYTTLPVPGPSCPKLAWDNPGHPATSHYLTPPWQSQVQVAMGQPGTSWDVPLPYTALPVPGLSCPKLPWDNPGHPRNLPLSYTTLAVPDSETATAETQTIGNAINRLKKWILLYGACTSPTCYALLLV